MYTSPLIGLSQRVSASTNLLRASASWCFTTTGHRLRAHVTSCTRDFASSAVLRASLQARSAERSQAASRTSDANAASKVESVASRKRRFRSSAEDVSGLGASASRTSACCEPSLPVVQSDDGHVVPACVGVNRRLHQHPDGPFKRCVGVRLRVCRVNVRSTPFSSTVGSRTAALRSAVRSD